MVFLIPALLLALLARSQAAMNAASSACKLFVESVLPGLFPYMTLTLLLASRCKKLPLSGALLLGWGGGSPMGAKMAGRFQGKQQRFLLVAAATMSPMFLMGTVGKWLNDPIAGGVVLLSTLGSGLLTGWIASVCGKTGQIIAAAEVQRTSIPQAVEQAMRTMLTICGTMMLARTLAALAEPILPDAALLPLMTLLEASTSIAAIAGKPWPTVWRTALIAGAAGFGGTAVLMQNRASAPGAMGMLPQIIWQGVHGVLSFLLALGIMSLL